MVIPLLVSTLSRSGFGCISGGSVRCVAPRSGGSLVQIVFHDRAVAAVAVALQRVDVAFEVVGLRQHGVDLGLILLRSARRSKWRGWRRDGTRLRAPTMTAATAFFGSMAALATVAMSTPCRSAIPRSVPEQRLEKIPAAEIVDDQLVFDQRAVLEVLPAPAGRASGRRGSRRPPCRSRAARRRLPAAASTMRLAGRASSSEYCTCIEVSGTPASTMCSMRSVSKLVPLTLWILPASLSSFSQPRRLQPPRRGVVPPVELHEVEPVELQPAQRLVDDAFDIALVDALQHVEVGHELGVHLDARERFLAAQIAVAQAEAADQLLDAGVDVGAVEGGDAGVGEGDHVGDRIVALHRAVAGGELPAAADDARNLVVRREA